MVTMNKLDCGWLIKLLKAWAKLHYRYVSQRSYFWGRSIVIVFIYSKSNKKLVIATKDRTHQILLYHHLLDECANITLCTRYLQSEY
jgi:hypothetical protein